METSWYQVALSDQDVIAGKGLELQDLFSVLFLSKGGPKDAAMFCSRSSQENNFYFTPGAVNIAKELIARYRGVECPAPLGSALSLLVADAMWEEFLLPPFEADA
jgi:hypothetical protein